MSPHTGSLEPDRAEIGRFVDAILRHADEGTFVSLRSFAHGAGTKPFAIKAVRINGSLEPVTDQAVWQARQAANHRDPIVFAPPVATFSNAEHAGEADLANGLAVSVECDAKPKAAREHLERLLGSATFVIASGGEWTDPASGEVQDKLHLHWRLSEPTRTLEEHAKLKMARKLAALLVGADTTNVPPVHCLRWPGSWHKKGSPRLCRILELSEDQEVHLDETLELLQDAAKAAGLDLEKVKATGGGEDRDTAELVRLITTGTEYLRPLVALSARYAGRGMSAAQIGQTLRGFLEAVPEPVRDVKDGARVAGRWADRVANLERMARSAVAKFGPKADAVHPAAEFLDKIGRKNGDAAEQPENDDGFDLSHDGLALEMGARWTDTARHVALWAQWLLWNGTKWERDEKLRHMTATRAFLRSKADQIKRWAGRKLEKAEALPEGKERNDAVEEAEAVVAWAEAQEKPLRSAPMVANVVGLARSNAELAAGTAQWDADPWKLNTPAGIVDLRTGTLAPSDPLAYCTKGTAVAPAPPGTPAPLWTAFLERVFRHDPELIGFMQRVLGYGLTGLTTEHALIFAWGQGGNGKGVLLNSTSHILGDYAAIAPADLLLVTQSDRHPCDMAMLRAARLVTAQELAPGRAWDEPKLKSLTGGDPITARFIRQDFFTYEPQFLLVVAGNHKPSFRGVDEAIRRRVQLVPFLQNIPEAERDKELPERLKAEWPAVLRWLIDGCLAWQREGLNPPASVREASEDYLNAEDVLGQWLGERCLISAKIEFTPVGQLYGDWKDWCGGSGLQPGSAKAFSQRLGERGIKQARRMDGRGFAGIGLLPKAWHREDAATTGHDGYDGYDGCSDIGRKARERAHTHTNTSIKGASVTSVMGADPEPAEPSEFDL